MWEASENNPDMVSAAGSLFPFPIKMPDDSRVYTIKTIKRMISLI